LFEETRSFVDENLVRRKHAVAVCLAFLLRIPMRRRILPTGQTAVDQKRMAAGLVAALHRLGVVIGISFLVVTMLYFPLVVEDRLH